MAKDKTVAEKIIDLQSSELGTVDLVDIELTKVNKQIYKLEEKRTLLLKRKMQLKLIEEL